MNKPLSFGMTMLASALGVVVVSVVSGLLMFIMLISMVVALSNMDDDGSTVAKKNTFLVVDLDRISGDRTASGLMQSFGDGKTVGLIDAIDAINAAADDQNVSGLLLKGDGSLSWASLEELRAAISTFASGDKPVVSYATSYSQGGYYLCSAADMMCLHPSGMVDFRGIGGEVMYYKDLFDKLGVEMNLIRPESCSYKSACEVYTLNHMSAANREQIRAYIGSVWRTATADIAASRGISVGELNTIADNLSGYLADDARSSRLVDTLCFEEDVRAMLKEHYDGKHLLPLEKYAKSKYGDKFNVLGIAVWDNPDDTRKAIEELKITWPVIVGTQKLTEPTDLYGIKGIPHIIIFGADGTILSRGLTGDDLAARLEEALKNN